MGKYSKILFYTGILVVFSAGVFLPTDPRNTSGGFGDCRACIGGHWFCPGSQESVSLVKQFP